MADHAKPRVLRVFVGDRTTAPRPGADTDDGIRAAVTVSDAIDTFLAAVDDRSARDRRGGAPHPPAARGPRRGPARPPREAPWGEAARAGRPRPVEGGPPGVGGDGGSPPRCR